MSCTIARFSYGEMGFAAIAIYVQASRTNVDLSHQLDRTMRLVETNLAKPLWNLDKDMIDNFADVVFLDNSVVYVHIPQGGDAIRRMDAGSDRGISRFDGTIWQRVFPVPGNLSWPVDQIIETSDIWVATVWGGLKLGVMPTIYITGAMADVLRSQAPQYMKIAMVTCGLDCLGGREVVRRDRDGQWHLVADDVMSGDRPVITVMMPQMNGPELAQRLKPLRPNMRVLFMSGYLDETVSLSERDAFVLKPFNQQTLLENIRKLLDKRPECDYVSNDCEYSKT